VNTIRRTTHAAFDAAFLLPPVEVTEQSLVTTPPPLPQKAQLSYNGHGWRATVCLARRRWPMALERPPIATRPSAWCSPLPSSVPSRG